MIVCKETQCDRKHRNYSLLWKIFLPGNTCTVQEWNKVLNIDLEMLISNRMWSWESSHRAALFKFSLQTRGCETWICSLQSRASGARVKMMRMKTTTVSPHQSLGTHFNRFGLDYIFKQMHRPHDVIVLQNEITGHQVTSQIINNYALKSQAIVQGKNNGNI